MVTLQGLKQIRDCHKHSESGSVARPAFLGLKRARFSARKLAARRPGYHLVVVVVVVVVPVHPRVGCLPPMGGGSGYQNSQN